MAPIHFAAAVLLCSALAAALVPLHHRQSMFGTDSFEQPSLQIDDHHPSPHYPTGKCMRCPSKELKPTCRGGKCKATSRCNSIHYPALAPSYGMPTDTRCMPNARAKCSEPGMWSCAACHNWVVLQAECGAKGKPKGGQQCERRGRYSVMRQAPSAGHERRCAAADRWLVLPNIPCTGIEDPDPACTGPAGEVWWQHAWQEGLAHGFPPPRHHNTVNRMDNTNSNYHSSTNTNSSSRHAGATWVMLMASPAYRAHQQMHIHIGWVSTSDDLPIAKALRGRDFDGSRTLPKECVSIHPKAPSLRTLKVNSTGGSLFDSAATAGEASQQPGSGNAVPTNAKERRAQAVPVTLISVFVPAKSASQIATKVRPFETARAAVTAVPQATGLPYVLMVTAHSQPWHGCSSSSSSSSDGSYRTPGSMLGAHEYNAVPAGAGNPSLSGAHEPSTHQVRVKGAENWVSGFVVTAMLRGNQVWLMQEQETKHCFGTCPLPPPPS